MNNIASILISLIVILTFSSCNEDSIATSFSPPIPSNESVSGSAFFDLSGDGLGEEPMTNACVFLGDSSYMSTIDVKDTVNLDPEVLKTTVDIDGNYLFEGVIPAINQVIRLIPNYEYSDLVGVDNIPDGDVNETDNNELIQISIEEDEADDGNDFVAFKVPIISVASSISGYIFEDIDEDLIGDLPVPNHRLELYERNAEGLPITSSGFPIAEAYSDDKGFFAFKDIPKGEYVIYHIGTGEYQYTCVSNMDESPEIGEPASNGLCIFIPVNLTNTIVEDHDNVYVINKAEFSSPGSLSGTISEDITSDGQPDELTDLIITVDIFERDNNGFATGPILYSTNSKPDGSFSFDEINSGKYVVKLREDPGVFEAYYGTAFNGGPHPLPNVFPLTIQAGEMISNAIFWIYTFDNIPSINGRVYEDSNGDGIGDTETYEQAVELYLRGSDNLPTGDLLYKTNHTGGSSSFYFTNLNSGEYILVLAESTDYTCIFSGDETPENNEPGSTSACKYILVDFLVGRVDEDNNYVIRKQ